MFSALIDQGPFILLAVGALGAVVGVVSGVGVALVQRFALLHPVLMTEEWVLGTMGAWALAGALYEVLYWIAIPLDEALMNEVPRYAIIGAGVGLGFGLCQWLAARHCLTKLHLLLLANVISWSAALTTARLIYQIYFGTAFGYVLSIVVGGIVAGLVTGLTLIRLARRHLVNTI
jgi:hypothetical protein